MKGAGRRGGGIMGTLVSLVLFVAIAGGVLAVAKVNNIHDAKSLYQWAKKGSDKTRECYLNEGEGCIKVDTSPAKPTKITGLEPDQKFNYKTPSVGGNFLQPSARQTKQTMRELLDKIKVQPHSKDKLKSNEWAHWKPLSDNSDCWTVADEVLATQGVVGKNRYLDKQRKSTSKKIKACSLKSGEWKDAFTGKLIKNPKNAVVDYLIPLDTVATMGTEKWSKDKKERFANDKDNLIIISKDTFKQRKNKDIVDYQPKKKTLTCSISKRYISQAKQYKLRLDTKQKNILEKGIKNCKE